MRLILLGPPGAGKGTQGQALAADFGVPHVATGDLIRDHIERGTEFGRKVEAATAAGNFAPDADILYWVGQRLSEPDAARGFILDGFPRDLTQAQAFGQPIDAVIELVLGSDALIERLSNRLVCPHCDAVYNAATQPPRVVGICDLDGTPLTRRPDDDPEAIRHRLEVYNQLTLPLRDYYAGQNLLLSVEADGSVDMVHQRIREALSLGSIKTGD